MLHGTFLQDVVLSILRPRSLRSLLCDPTSIVTSKHLAMSNHSFTRLLPPHFVPKRELDDALHQMRLLDLNPTPLIPPNNPLQQVQ